ncbi:MAG: NADH-quinone oxidoreductase subunit M [Pseudanabaenaceae cyanobacterium]
MLSVLIAVAFGGALAVGLWPVPLAAARVRQLALAIATGLVGWSGLLLGQFDLSHPALQLVERVPWLEMLGLSYALGVDGFALPLVVLTSVLVWVAIFSSRTEHRPRFYYSLILAIAGGVYGAFTAQNLLLFLLFYEVELVPLYFLIAIWGGSRRQYAAVKFLLYTALSGFLLLGAFLGTAGLAGNPGLNFDWQALAPSPLPLRVQGVLLVAIVVAFAIKIPIVPFHTWLPDAHVEASTPISVLLAGVLLKLGTYGLLRFGWQLFPQAWQNLAPALAWLAAVSTIYGCSVAISQKDMKKMVAYSSVGHMGYVLLALAAHTPIALTGAALQMVSHGLISALLFLVVGIVYEKTGTRDIDALNGLFNPERGLPLTGTLMVIGAMASAGIPGMVGFVAEFAIFRGSFAVFPVPTLLCLVGTGLTSVYYLILLDRAFFGRLAAPMLSAGGALPTLPPVHWQDLAPPTLLLVPILLFGLQPHWLVRWIVPAVR